MTDLNKLLREAGGQDNVNKLGKLVMADSVLTNAICEENEALDHLDVAWSAYLDHVERIAGEDEPVYDGALEAALDLTRAELRMRSARRALASAETERESAWSSVIESLS